MFAVGGDESKSNLIPQNIKLKISLCNSHSLILEYGGLLRIELRTQFDLPSSLCHRTKVYFWPLLNKVPPSSNSYIALISRAMYQAVIIAVGTPPGL